MKTVILCGGRGTRLGEHGTFVPKALVRIGDDPIIWHLLNLYSQAGLNDFVICLGFLAEEITNYFKKRGINAADNEFTQSQGNELVMLDGWGIELVDTGFDTNTGGRLKQIQRFLADDETFCVTYGDGLADVDIVKLLAFHKSHGKIATLTAVHPVSNFGMLDLDENGRVADFREKPVLKEWVNGGFFVFNRAIFDYLDDNSVLEGEPLMRLAAKGELMAYQHDGFWKCMDTYKDSIEFNQLWEQGAPWQSVK